VRAQAPGQGGRERDGRGGERGRHYPAGRLGRPGRQVGLGLLDHRQDALGVAGQTAARVGQLGPAGGPVEQGGAGLALERGELLRHGGRRVAEDGGRTAMLPRAANSWSNRSLCRSSISRSYSQP